MAAARKSTMTAEHKRALAQGRAEGRAVRSYLEALDQNRPRRGVGQLGELDPVRLDDGIGEQPTTHLVDLRSSGGVVGRVDHEPDALADTHVRDVLVAERGQ